MEIDRTELDKLINEGMIIDNRHKSLPLTIFNYSKIADAHPLHIVSYDSCIFC